MAHIPLDYGGEKSTDGEELMEAKDKGQHAGPMNR
jgi:hypothetical protein